VPAAPRDVETKKRPGLRGRGEFRRLGWMSSVTFDTAPATMRQSAPGLRQNRGAPLSVIKQYIEQQEAPE
jgi:hypothetical protein